MKEEHMEQVAGWMKDAVTHHSDEKYLEKLSAEVKDFCLQFTLPSD